MMAAQQHSNGKYLGDLLEGLDQALAHMPITGLQLDSREIIAGEVFLACTSSAVDGRDYIDHAIDSGAVAILVELGGQWQANSYYRDVPLLVVKNLRDRLSEIAGNFFGHPSRHLPVIGITGTNGKTTCSHLLMQLLQSLGHSCGVIGTLGCGVDGAVLPAINTTPDAISIQKLLSLWHGQSVDAAAMEVSSHGLDQGRVASVVFSLAIFTNLSRDHLDYHQTMEAYAAAKVGLFKQAGLNIAVMNADDAYSDYFIEQIPAAVKCYRYSLHDNTADIRVENICYTASGVSASLHSPWGQGEFSSELIGDFNLSNLLAVITALCALGYPLIEVLAKVDLLRAVAGRMELVSAAASVHAVVDYAHTPAALQAALQALQLHKQGQLWCVFGCGGDRDKGKRREMAEVAQRLADQVVVTSDNPRSESATAIIDDIMQGFTRPVLVEEDRAKAIALAVQQANAGDSILIAGKGHEDYQLIDGQRLPFSDVQQVRLAIAVRGQA